MRHRLIRMLLCLLPLVPALGGMQAGFASEPACAQTATGSRACCCTSVQGDTQDREPPASGCACPQEAPCQVSQAPPAAALELLVTSQPWPDAPGLAGPIDPILALLPVSRPADQPRPLVRPPGTLYLLNSSLLI